MPVSRHHPANQAKPISNIKKRKKKKKKAIVCRHFAVTLFNFERERESNRRGALRCQFSPRKQIHEKVTNKQLETSL